MSEKIEAGEGYRLLGGDDVIQSGDQFWARDDREWIDTTHEKGDGIQIKQYGGAIIYRRKLTQPATGWISVKERLPEEGSAIWIYAREVKTGKPYVIYSVSLPMWNKISHWQPASVPAPPSTEAEKAYDDFLASGKLTGSDSARDFFIAGFNAGQKAEGGSL